MKGFLFIGDPHAHSRRIGRRIDDYTSSVLEKLRIAGEIARELDLVPVILGDLFHQAHELLRDPRNDMPRYIAMLSRITEILKGYPRKAIVLGGNHDKAETLLRHSDVLYLLGVADVIEVFDGECREAARFDFEGQSVALWVAPHGSVIPTRIDSDTDLVCLITHADLAFPGAYPGAAPLHEIAGCAFVVNGHMHGTTPSIVIGQTAWHNPGNIEPIAADYLDHKPAVWSWQKGQPTTELKPHYLPHNRDCFDMTGYIVPAASKADSIKAIEASPSIEPVIPSETSQFAELLLAQTGLEMHRKDDNESFVVELQAGFEQLNASESVRTLLLTLEQGLPAPAVEALDLPPAKIDEVKEEVA